MPCPKALQIRLILPIVEERAKSACAVDEMSMGPSKRRLSEAESRMGEKREAKGASMLEGGEEGATPESVQEA